jgi:hypothetical protein
MHIYVVYILYFTPLHFWPPTLLHFVTHSPSAFCPCEREKNKNKQAPLVRWRTVQFRWSPSTGGGGGGGGGKGRERRGRLPWTVAWCKVFRRWKDRERVGWLGTSTSPTHRIFIRLQTQPQHRHAVPRHPPTTTPPPSRITDPYTVELTFLWKRPRIYGKDPGFKRPWTTRQANRYPDNSASKSVR